MLDLRLLRFFIAIYEEKNITAAAARCHVSQPSLSAGLRQLEESLGDSLFIRGKKGWKRRIRPTISIPTPSSWWKRRVACQPCFAKRRRVRDSTWPSCPTSAAVGWRDCFGGCRGTARAGSHPLRLRHPGRLPTDPGCPAPGGRDLPAALGRGVRAVRSQGTPSCGQGAYRAG